MNYYFNKVLDIPFNDAVSKVTEGLKQEGFGILTEIDVQATMKQKLDATMPGYKILGACNPSFAHQALQMENKIGIMLPCNVIVQQTTDGVEVAAVNPIASMQSVDNLGLKEVAEQVSIKLKAVIEHL